MQRRSLLGLLGLAPLAAVSGPVAAASARTVATAPVVADLEVFRLPVNRRGNWIILRLRTANGLVGLGDASHGGHEDQTFAWLKELAALLRGRSVFDIEWFRQAAARKIGARRSPAATVAASGLEQCLWDLAGRALGVPTYDLFGGRIHDRIRLYANINRSTDPRTPEGFAAMARAGVDAGFDAFKLAPFDALPMGLEDRSQVEGYVRQGLACAQAVRDAIGPKRDLLIDAHSRFTLREGLDLLERVKPLSLFWLEEVTPADPPTDLAAINRAATMKTAGGEAIYGVEGFYAYLKADAVDIAMPDVKLCGGMMELKKIAAIAEGAGLPVSPHGPASPIGNIAAAQVMATVPNFNILEFSFGEVPWRAELLRPQEEVTGGSLALSSKPGFGVDLDDTVLAKRGGRV